MEKIGLLDVKILSLGIKNEDRIDEKILEKSELTKAGTGRVLDNLASLIERNLIKLNEDKSFQVTNTAKQILWNQEIPFWVKILRILDVSSLSIEKITGYLNENQEKIETEIENLRKNQLVLMSALRTEQGLEQIFEILPEGKEELEKIKTKGYEYSNPKLGKTSNTEVFGLLDEISNILAKSDVDEELKKQIREKISKIQSKLDI